MSDTFAALSAKYNINWNGDPDHEAPAGAQFVLDQEEYAPCFLRIAELPVHFEEADILPYLRACAQQTVGVVVLSTTEREPMHQSWLDAAKKIRSSRITAGRSINHGGYKVWLITLTGTKK